MPALRIALPVLTALLFLGSLAFGQAADKSFPEPPQQHKPWTPPKTDVPNDVVKALAKLFDQGLPDPRGCEYRVIQIAERSDINLAELVDRTSSGFVLPARPGESQRYAILWDGLITPIVSFGDKVDLDKDFSFSSDWIDGNPSRLGNPARLGLLLRLGEGERATKLWRDMNHPKPGPDQGYIDPYFEMADAFMEHCFRSAVFQRKSGEDETALQNFRGLAAFAKLPQPAGLLGSSSRHELFEFLKELPPLLADQERRAKEKPRTVICRGPGRSKDQDKRIGALIELLDELSSGCFTDGVFEPIAAELIFEGCQHCRG